jgi:hypothetical protein
LEKYIVFLLTGRLIRYLIDYAVETIQNAAVFTSKKRADPGTCWIYLDNEYLKEGVLSSRYWT